MGQTSSTSGSTPVPEPQQQGGMTVHTLPSGTYPILTNPTPTNITVHNVLPTYPETFAITIENVFTPEECDELISLSEKQGYEQALVNVGYGEQQLRTDIRNNDRCVIDSHEFANVVYTRIIDNIPKQWTHRNHQWDLVEVNERMRLLRYGPGMEFRPHYDGTYLRPKGHPKQGDASFITLQIYLNDVEKGGETTFFMAKPTKDCYSRAEANAPREEIPVNPKKGMVILFQHNVLHSGSIVEAGQKYCIRSDVMFHPVDKIIKPKEVIPETPKDDAPKEEESPKDEGPKDEESPKEEASEEVQQES